MLLALSGWLWAMRLSKKSATAEAQSRASMVAGWVDSRSIPAVGAGRYMRHATLRLENQSEQPVYNVYLEVGIARSDGSWLALGPISAPSPVRVLPPRGAREWDISLALLPYTEDINELTGDIAVSLYFDDPSGQRWSRGFASGLKRLSESKSGELMREVSPGPEQLGPDSLLNPTFVTRLFLRALFGLLDGESDDVDFIRGLLDPAATGWSSWTLPQFVELAEDLKETDLAAYVHYPAPRVCYIKLLHAGEVNKRVEHGPQTIAVQAQILTLRFNPGWGWRIFDIGVPVPFDTVPFPERDLDSDLLLPPVAEL